MFCDIIYKDVILYIYNDNADSSNNNKNNNNNKPGIAKQENLTVKNATKHEMGFGTKLVPKQAQQVSSSSYDMHVSSSCTDHQTCAKSCSSKYQKRLSAPNLCQNVPCSPMPSSRSSCSRKHQKRLSAFRGGPHGLHPQLASGQ
jgi:hypothetical protein